jgi:hypothetical protein
MRKLAPFAIALVVYVALGLATKSFVLNWIVGPLFLLIVLDLLPRAVGLKPFFDLDAPPRPVDTEDTTAT